MTVEERVRRIEVLIMSLYDSLPFALKVAMSSPVSALVLEMAKDMADEKEDA